MTSRRPHCWLTHIEALFWLRDLKIDSLATFNHHESDLCSCDEQLVHSSYLQHDSVIA
ncbi:hypothetical protein ASPCADRAFT_210814 [Aspergillus carbonarius ITEM 5010]|uniref:Uncharacterized protein n=1 Tax=Aspergillus carbonarius (strain ITEM 5010) TaxID=602072 RepID=A0A1R3RBN7_ASPC5|nr:hypothetical protein ASPCADRAFT_210814 [Aspergillus carbonarius ITEM 5010]